MGRRRARPALASAPPASGSIARTPPRGVARLAWSVVGALIIALLAGLGFAIADSVQSSACADGDATCALASFTLGGLLGALVGVPVAAGLLRLGWEWALPCAAVVCWMPALLDTGSWAWALPLLAPVAAGGATWTGADRPPWRPWVISLASAAATTAAIAFTFVSP